MRWPDTALPRRDLSRRTQAQTCLRTPNAGQAEWRDYRACWWDVDQATMDFGPVLRVLVTG